MIFYTIECNKKDEEISISLYRSEKPKTLISDLNHMWDTISTSYDRFYASP